MSPCLDPRRLEKIFSDTDRVMACLTHLETLLLSADPLKTIRFDPNAMLKKLEPVLREQAMSPETDEEAFGERVVARVMPALLKRPFIRRTEKALENFILNSGAPDRDIDAAMAGLFFAEQYRRDSQPDNPLWKIIFRISYGELLEAVETLSGSRPDAAFDTAEHRLSEAEQACLSEAVALIDRHGPDVVFSLETVLVGLVTDLRHRNAADTARRVSALRETFRREIGPREVEDLLSGLDYLERLDVLPDAGKRIDVVRRAVRLLPAQDNPVVFSIYFISIRDFYRYWGAEHRELLEALVADPADPAPVIRHGFKCLLEGRNTSAVKVFDALETLAPGSVPAEFGAGVALWRDGSFREARLRWSRAARYSADASRAALKTLCEQLSRQSDDAPLPPEADRYVREIAGNETTGA